MRHSLQKPLEGAAHIDFYNYLTGEEVEGRLSC